MNQVAPLAVRLLLIVFCGFVALLALFVGRASTTPTSELAYLCAAIFSVLAAFAFTHPRSVLGGLALPIGVGFVGSGASDWHTAQIVPIALGTGVFFVSLLVFRLALRRIQTEPLGLLVGILAIGGIEFGLGVVGHSSLGLILLGSLFIAYGAESIVSSVKHHVGQRPSGDA